MSRNIVEYTASYEHLPFEPIQAAYRRRRVLSEIARHRPARLLEVGCGHAPLFSDLDGIAITVVEPAPAFAERARLGAACRPDVHVVEAFLEEAHLPTTRFDMVVVGCLLHEVDDPQSLLAAVRRHCDPHTVLHLSVPNANSLHRLLAVAMGLIDSPKALSSTQLTMQQRSTYDSQALHAELNRAGFRVTDSGSLFVKPFTHAQMQQLVDQGFMTTAMLDGLDRLADVQPDLGSEIWVNARLADG